MVGSTPIVNPTRDASFRRRSIESSESAIAASNACRRDDAVDLFRKRINGYKGTRPPKPPEPDDRGKRADIPAKWLVCVLLRVRGPRLTTSFAAAILGNSSELPVVIVGDDKDAHTNRF